MPFFTRDHMRDLLYLDTFHDDIQFNNVFSLGGVADPTSIQWPANGGNVWRFGVGDELLFGKEITHAWKLSSDGHVHVHWSPQAYGVVENGNQVGWRVDLSITDVNDVVAAVGTYNLTATVPNANNQHLIQEATLDLDLSSIVGVSAWISGRVYRVADSWSSAVPAEQPYLLQAGIHIELDRPGSREEYTK